MGSSFSYHCFVSIMQLFPFSKKKIHTNSELVDFLLYLWLDSGIFTTKNGAKTMHFGVKVAGCVVGEVC